MNTATIRAARPILLAVALGLALALLWTFAIQPLQTGREPDTVSVPVAPAVQDGEGAADADMQEPIELPVETYEVFLARDPFQPLVPVATGGGTTGGGTDGGTDGGTTGGGTTGGGTTGGTATNPCSGGTGEVVCEGQVVSLVDVFDNAGVETARIQVDSTIYEVIEGQTFATSYLVLAIDPPCVTLLYGDDTFQLCEGDVVLK